MSLVETYRGIDIRRFDVPCTPLAWVHEEQNGHGLAETIEQARAQIDQHWSRIVREVEPMP